MLDLASAALTTDIRRMHVTSAQASASYLSRLEVGVREEGRVNVRRLTHWRQEQRGGVSGGLWVQFQVLQKAVAKTCTFLRD